MIDRTLQTKVVQLARHYPIVTITGPRQSGKTTLCRMVFPDKAFVSLEAPDVREYARTDPRGFLSHHAAGAVLDEVQRVPELLSYLQVDVDERPPPGRFVLTGSANLALLDAVSQSLAGRTALVNLLPLGREEVVRFARHPTDVFTALWTGAYPAVYDREVPPEDWFASYVATYVERDVRQVLNVTDLVAFQTFLGLCAGRTGQLLNLSSLGADAGITHNTARAWLSVLEAGFLVFRLPPFHGSLKKRLVKTPKLHFYDSGLLCYLVGIRSPEPLRSHPLRGGIFESWVASEILKARLHRGLPGTLSYYRDRKGEEVDAILERGDALVAVEAKSGETIADDFFAALECFEQALAVPGRARKIEKVLVYGGDWSGVRSGTRVLPWSEVSGFGWAA